MAQNVSVSLRLTQAYSVELMTALARIILVVVLYKHCKLFHLMHVITDLIGQYMVT